MKFKSLTYSVWQSSFVEQAEGNGQMEGSLAEEFFDSVESNLSDDEEFFDSVESILSDDEEFFDSLESMVGDS